MEVRLSKENYYLTPEGRFDIRRALITAGLKAGVCFKPGQIAPWDVRSEDEEKLIKRGLSTIVSDHVTPTQQVSVSLEIHNIPKILCMYLNNVKMEAADERSLRYTELTPSELLSEQEIKLYNKWLGILSEILWGDYKDFFLQTNGNDEKTARAAIKKIAQENARNFVTVFMPTSLTYTTNMAEINKVALQIYRTISCDSNTELEKLSIPHLQDLYNQLLSLGVIVTNNDIYAINRKLATDFNLPEDTAQLYKDTKHIDLNLFANKNPFSGINEPDEFGVTFHAVRKVSLSATAQLQRHRTLDTEISIPKEVCCFVPQFLNKYSKLVKQWIDDFNSLNPILFPQGLLVNVGMAGSLKDLVTYVGGERACTRAQYECSGIYMNLIQDYYRALEEKHSNLAMTLKPYVKRYRCQSGYECSSPCPGGPRPNRVF